MMEGSLLHRMEYLPTDLAVWELGPFHSALPGPMLLRLKLDGEVIVDCEVETGFLHKGLEKAMELHPWRSVLPYCDHVEPETAVFGELAFCGAVENIAGIEVPERARAVRVILCELTRISSHLGFIIRMAEAVHSETAVQYVLRDRERILDLFELLTGARFSLNFLRYGGVASDVSEGFLERVLEVCDLVRLRIKEYNDLLSFNQALLKRTVDIGVLEQTLVAEAGLTGPNARASGLPFDARITHPYSGYDRIDFRIPEGEGEFGTRGDAHDRYLIRLREINESIEIIRQLAGGLPNGPYVGDAAFSDGNVPAGEAYFRVESPRGLFGCHVVSDGGPRPHRVQFRTPSVPAVSIVPSLIVGFRIEDLPLILASLDISLAEVDR